jgi:hypothetical protein
MNREKLRLRVWDALHTYYWDAAKLRAWYERLCNGDKGIEDIARGMDKYPDLDSIRAKAI